MNDIFSLSRFGKYLTYEMRKATINYGWSALLLGLMPLTTFFIYELIMLTTTGGFQAAGLVLQIPSLIITLLMLTFGAPAKVYGQVTEKRAGSNYLMIPASRLEKFLSMMVIIAVLLPVAVSCLYLLSDVVMSWAFPVLYGKSMTSVTINDFLSKLSSNSYIELSPIVIPLSLMLNMLVFMLGAIFFKKTKTGKTLLSLMFISIVVTTAMGVCIDVVNWDFSNLDAYLESFTPQRLVNVLNVWINVYYLFWFSLLLGGVWYRLKTLKH